MPIGCNNEDDCLSLRDGRWGRMVGVRVTHVAAGMWAGVLLVAAGLASGVAGEGRSHAMHAVLCNLLAAGVLVASLAGGWFLLLQAIVLRRWWRRDGVGLCENSGTSGCSLSLLAAGQIAAVQLPLAAVGSITIFAALAVERVVIDDALQP